MTFLWVLIAVLLGLAGILFLSKATTGVGLIGLACLLGIFARLEQASAHQKRVTEFMTVMLRSSTDRDTRQTGGNL